jgi:hypothetical protein
VGEVWSDDNATGSPVLGVEVVSGAIAGADLIFATRGHQSAV